MPPQLSQQPPVLNLLTTGATLPATPGKTAPKNCAGAMPIGRLPLQRLVAMAPSWLQKLLQHQLLLQHEHQLLPQPQHQHQLLPPHQRLELLLLHCLQQLPPK